MLNIILSSLVIMLTSLVGVVSVWRWLGFIMEKNLGYLVSFTAGVFMIVFFQMTGEVMHYTNSWYEGGLWILLGAFLWWGVFTLLPDFHSHTDTVTEISAKKISISRLLVADIFHNIGDGILLTSAFIASPYLGIATTASVFLHELVQEIGQFFILRREGLSVPLALGVNFAVSSSILIGSIGSFFMFDTFSSLELPFLGIVAGAFLVIVLVDFIPHSHHSSASLRDYALHILWFIIGAMIMFGVNAVAGHSHEGEGGHNHDHESDIHDDTEHEHHDEEEHDHEEK